MSNLKAKIDMYSVKAYQLSQDTLRKFREKKGASTVEYVVVLGAAAALAGILYDTLQEDGKSYIESAIKKAFSEVGGGGGGN